MQDIGGRGRSAPILRRRRQQLGAFISERRGHLDLTATELGDRIGVSRWRLRDFETGDRSIPSELLPALAIALQVDVRALLEHLYVDPSLSAARAA